MSPAPIDSTELAREFAELELLVLHGSRARDDAHGGSDWDVGYLANGGFDELGLRARLSRELGTDAVDVVDLGRAGGLLRYRVAGEGKVLFERSEGVFERFALRAIFFWLDAGAVVRPAYDAVLEELG